MNREKIMHMLPEIKGIRNEDLKNKVIEVWLKAIELTNWENVEDIPFNYEIPKENATLVKHIRAVTNYSLKMAEIMNNFYNYNVNEDYVIAGALIHDVSKMIEYSVKGGKSNIGNLIPHGAYGVHLCIELGLPPEVTHIVASHTKKMNMPTKSIEAIIVHHCDFADANSIALKNGHDFF